MTTHSCAIALPFALLLMVGACGKSNDTAATMAKDASTAVEQPLHCSDFVNPDEAKALGFDVSRYKELNVDGTSAVSCSLGGAMVGIFRGDRFSGAGGMKQNAASSGVKVEDGPKIGGDSQWGTIEGTTSLSVTFISTKGNYSANVGGTDKAMLEKLAQALEAKFEAQ